MCSSDLSGATTSSYSPTLLDYNKAITVTTTVDQVGYVLTISTSSPVIIGPGSMPIPTASFSGESTMDKTLTASATGYPSGTKLTYQWLRDSLPIASATRSTYKITALDTKHAIGLRVTFNKTGYTPVTVAVSAVVTAEGVFSRSPIPTILGAYQVGKTLTMTVGAWDSGTKLTYQWLRNGSPIAGAIGKTYKVTASDVGKSITATVTGVKLGYQTVTRTSAAGQVN